MKINAEDKCMKSIPTIIRQMYRQVQVEIGEAAAINRAVACTSARSRGRGGVKRGWQKVAARNSCEDRLVLLGDLAI